MGKFNSTTVENGSVDEDYRNDESLPGQPRKKNWWLTDSAVARRMKAEVEDEDYEVSEYSTFNPNDSIMEEVTYSEVANGSFPVPLNAEFDLQALIMVCLKRL